MQRGGRGIDLGSVSQPAPEALQATKRPPVRLVVKDAGRFKTVLRQVAAVILHGRRRSGLQDRGQKYGEAGQSYCINDTNNRPRPDLIIQGIDVHPGPIRACNAEVLRHLCRHRGGQPTDMLPLAVALEQPLAAGGASIGGVTNLLHLVRGDLDLKPVLKEARKLQVVHYLLTARHPRPKPSAKWHDTTVKCNK